MKEITVTEKQSVVLIHGITKNSSEFLYKVFTRVRQAGISIDMLSNAPEASDNANFGFSVSDNDMFEIPKIISEADGAGLPEEKRVKTAFRLSVTMNHVKFVIKTDLDKGFAELVFCALKDSNTTPVLVSSGIDEISLLVREEDRVDFEKHLRKLFNMQ